MLQSTPHQSHVAFPAAPVVWSRLAHTLKPGVTSAEPTTRIAAIRQVMVACTGRPVLHPSVHFLHPQQSLPTPVFTVVSRGPTIVVPPVQRTPVQQLITPAARISQGYAVFPPSYPHIASSEATPSSASGISTPANLKDADGGLSSTMSTTISILSFATEKTSSSTPPPIDIPQKPASRFGGKQESDMLELCARASSCDETTSHVQLISLGCYCGPKLTFQKIGRGAETLPFDWLRTSLDGVLHMLRTNFQGFFEYTSRLPVPGYEPMVIYRGKLHSFWHDNPDEESMHERYTRRIARLYGMSSKDRRKGQETHPTLFVRVAASTDELPRIQELLDELTSIFGKEVFLLLILNWQVSFIGFASLSSIPNLLVYFADSSIHDREKQTVPGAPYAAAVQSGLQWAAGRPVKSVVFSELNLLLTKVDRNSWGYTGMGGLAAFECITAEGNVIP